VSSRKVVALIIGVFCFGLGFVVNSVSESILPETDSTREATIRNVTDQMNDISLTVSGQVADRLLYVRIANPAIFVESGF
jgi:hypothetical protein